MARIKVGVLRGGPSSEYDVSLKTGAAVLKNLPDTYEPADIFIDKVGVGKGAYDRLAEQLRNVVGVNAGEEPSDKSRFANLRAEMYWRTREWIIAGGKLEKDDDWYQLAQIKYKTDSYGRLKIISKEELLRHGIDSPDVSDSCALTFAKKENYPANSYSDTDYEYPEPIDDDPYF